MSNSVRNRERYLGRLYLYADMHINFSIAHKYFMGQGNYYYTPFTGKEIEIQRSEATCTSHTANNWEVRKLRAGPEKMAHWVKTLADKPHDLSSVPKPHMVEAEKQVQQVVVF